MLGQQIKIIKKNKSIEQITKVRFSYSLRALYNMSTCYTVQGWYNQLINKFNTMQTSTLVEIRHQGRPRSKQNFNKIISMPPFQTFLFYQSNMIIFNSPEKFGKLAFAQI